MPFRRSCHISPESLGHGSTNSRPMKKLIAYPGRRVDCRTEASHGTSSHYVYSVKATQQSWRHDSERSGSVFPNDPVNFLASLQEQEHCVVSRFGCTYYHSALNGWAFQPLDGGAKLRRMNDWFGEVLSRPRWNIGTGRSARGIDQLLASDRARIRNVHKPSIVTHFLHLGDSGVESSATDQVVILREVMEIVVDGLPSYVTIGRKAFLLHRIRRVLE